MFFLSTYFVSFLNFFLERGLRVGVKPRLLKLINGGGRGGLNKVRVGRKKIEKLSTPEYAHMHVYTKTSRSHLSSLARPMNMKNHSKVDKSFQTLLVHTSSKEKNIFLKRVATNSWYKLPN